MKKYLMTGIAAVAMCAAFTSCSKDLGFEQMTPEQQVQERYNQAFLKYLGVESIDPNQDWGFSATRGATRGLTRSGNTGETYPATHEYKDASDNVIAGANMNHNEWGAPNKEFGGWKVPDPLTDKQKEIVTAYFQSKPDISYQDPHLRHFFVQQVYKGNPTTAGNNSTEKVIAADGSEYTSNNMNHLTVGVANSHINNFNAGTCSTSDVLNHEGKTQKDEITLMVNVDDTSCFGYHDSGSSNQSDASPNHNDKAALVSWQTIRTWANANGYDGELLNDGWDRSFMGFDLAIKEGAQAYATDNNGNVLYADYSQAPTSPIYAWDGQNVIKIAKNDQSTNWQTVYDDAYKNIMKGTEAIGWLTTNKNFYIAADQITLTGEYNNGEIEQSSLNDEALQNVLVFKDVKVPGAQNNKAHVINLKRINELVNAGYLPVMNKSLQEWVKVGVSDGVFSDWIVTLTEAKRQVSEVYDLMIIAEDLSAQDNSDFDFNDVVLEVKYGSPAKVKLTYAGGTLPLVISTDGNINEDFEVHKLFGVQVNEMVNTGRGPNKAAVLLNDKGLNVNIANAAEANEKLKLFVYKGGSWQEMKAPKGEPACKLAVGMDFTVLGERQSIKHEYEKFVDWATSASFTSKWW
jgi:hypothetical protein